MEVLPNTHTGSVVDAPFSAIDTDLPLIGVGKWGGSYLFQLLVACAGVVPDKVKTVPSADRIQPGLAISEVLTLLAGELHILALGHPVCLSK